MGMEEKSEVLDGTLIVYFVFDTMLGKLELLKLYFTEREELIFKGLFSKP
jgi:hypothetical protein